jgi:hypothetical protein
MNHTCLGAGVVLAEKLNLYPCVLGLYMLPDHEHMGHFLVKHFFIAKLDIEAVHFNFLSIMSNAVMYYFNSFVFSYSLFHDV